MCQFICNLFRTTSNVISTTSKAVETGLNATNTVLNDLNKGLENFSNHLERKNKLYDIAYRVYENKLSINEAMLEARSKFGSEAYLDFENQLNKVKDLDYKIYSYKIFPLDEGISPLDQNNVIQILVNKYGEINDKEFNYHIEQRRSELIRILSNSNKFNYFELKKLSNQDLHSKFISRQKEIDEALKRFNLR